MVLIQIIICGSAAMYSTVWTLYHSDEFPYLDMDPYEYSFVYILFVAFGTWFIGFMDLVPISLMVTLEVVKFL
jgi:hypothetical protein